MSESPEAETPLELMRRIVAQYDSRETPEDKAAFLTVRGITPGVIQAYRKLIDIIDRRKVSPPTDSRATEGPRRHGPRRRTRRIRTGPPGHPGAGNRSARNPRTHTRITVIIIDFDLP